MFEPNISSRDNAAIRYVLVTPARNEAAFIDLAIRSVVAQTVRPVKWIIVNDGSTDATAEIVKKYVATHEWIDLIEMPERRDRHFAGKACAVRAAHQALDQVEYDVIGNLDADVSFAEDYFAFLMERFAENPKLGVAGTAFREQDLQYNYEFVGIEHVSGMCQMFRRECFEAIGGYLTVPSGGIDLIAVLSARAKGWDTRTFANKTFTHHRSQGRALHMGFRERLYMGRKDYLLGNHPIWEILRSLYQMQRKPYVVGGLLLFASYLWSWICRAKRTIPDELMVLRRSDQMKRLKLVVRRRLGAKFRLFRRSTGFAEDAR